MSPVRPERFARDVPRAWQEPQRSFCLSRVNLRGLETLGLAASPMAPLAQTWAEAGPWHISQPIPFSSQSARCWEIPVVGLAEKVRERIPVTLWQPMHLRSQECLL